MPKKQGFTLIELMVVVFIIGLLASIVTVSVSAARSRGRDTRRFADLDAVKTGLESYANEHNGRYPVATLLLCSNTFPTGWVPAGVAPLFTPDYITVLPRDPSATGNYRYCYRTNTTGTEYKLMIFVLETVEGRNRAQADAGNRNCPAGTANPVIDGTCAYEVYSGGGQSL